MNLPRFYCPEPLPAGENPAFDLPSGPARHAARVLRLGPGDGLVLFDGLGGQVSATIATVVKDKVAVVLGPRQAVERESRLSLTLVQALQGADKMDFTVQKAVELGVSRVVPVSSRRSVVRLDGERAAKRVEHWRGVAVSACEQCGRNRLPEVAPVRSLEAFLTQAAPAGGLRLMLAPDAPQALAALPPPAGEVQLLIGAEGGLAPEEMAAARQAGFMPVRLGPRVLRTETAGLAALAAIHALWGDFREEAHHV